MRRRLVLAAPAILLSRPGWAQNTPSDDLPGGSGITVPQGLVGYWPLNEGGGAIAFDRSGQGNNGTLSVATPPTWGVGQIKGALNFNGTNQSVDISGSGTVYATGAAPFGISLWFKTAASPAAFGRLLALKGSAGLFNVMYSTNATYGLFFGGSSWGQPLKVPLPAAAVWHHLFVTYNGSAIATLANYAAMIDGVTQTISAGGATGAQTNSSQIGTYAGGGAGELFAGQEDDIRVYKRAPTLAEGLSIYLAGLQGKP